MPMRGVFLDADSLHPEDLDPRNFLTTLPDWTLHPNTATHQRADRIRDAGVVVCNKVLLDAAILEQASRLQLICVTATGTNNIDLEQARRRNIAVCNVPGYATASVVEHLFGLLLTLSRRLDNYRSLTEAGDWSRSGQFCVFGQPIGELAGKTLGIIGFGELGRAVAECAAAFSMHVLVCQRPGSPPTPDRVPLATLLETVDVLSIHCPLTPATRGLIGKKELERMQPGAILINTARGGIVDEAALLQALQAGRLAGAALDVLEQEPPPADHPLIRARLPNLIITPHIAWASQSARQRLLDQTAANIQAFLVGEPQNLIV